MSALHQNEMRELLRDIQAEAKPFGQLGWMEQFKIGWEIFRLQTRIMFSQRFAWFLFALLVYNVSVYVINYIVPVYNRMQMDSLFIMLMCLPLTAMAVFLNMGMISMEKDNRSLELTFTIAGSRYKVWLLRFGSLCALFFVLTFTQALIAFFFFIDVPVFALTFHAYIPTFFVAGMVFYFAVKFRSGLGAGMVSGLVILLVFLFSELLWNTKYFLFFNPFEVPRDVDPAVWYDWTWQNRIGLFVLGGVMLFGALRGMNNRERLLR